nr:hypothetical protein [Tanacetum cinerariifolium]
MDLHWEMAILTIRAKRFIKRTNRNLDINGQKISFDKSKMECFNCYKNGHFARECKAPKNQENKGREYGRKVVSVENPTENDLIAHDEIRGYEWSYQAEEEHPTNYALMALTSLGSSFSSDSELVKERLAHYTKNEAVFEEKINILNLNVKLKDNALVENIKKLEKTEKERDELKLTLEKFQNSSKSLNNLLESQVSNKVKTRLGYKAIPLAVESFVNSSEMLENQENVKSRSDKGYHAILPPYAGNYIPPKPDLMFIDEQVGSESVDVVSNVASSAIKTVESKHEFVNVKNKGVYSTVETKPVSKNNFSPPIIEDWISDDESEVEFEPKVKVKTIRPSIKKIKFVKSAREKVEKEKNAILLSMKIMMVDLFLLEMVKVEFPAKILDESQVLLRVPRQDNIYSVDLKSVVPIGGIKREFNVARTPQQNVNTACYVLNSTLVIKPHNKTPYELIRGRPPLIDFMKPFVCLITILNTKDYLGKFDEKAYEGFFLLGTKDNIVARQAEKKKELEQEYTLIPICTSDPLISQGPKDSAVDAAKKATKTEHINSTNSINNASSPVSTTARPSFANTASPSLINAARTPASINAFSPFKNAFSLPHVPIVTPINDTGIFGNAYDDEAVEDEVDMNNVFSSYTILMPL